VFEDAVAGVEAAKAAGMACVAVRFVGHHSADAPSQGGTDRVVESLERSIPIARRMTQYDGGMDTATPNAADGRHRTVIGEYIRSSRAYCGGKAAHQRAPNQS